MMTLLLFTFIGGIFLIGFGLGADWAERWVDLEEEEDNIEAETHIV